MSSIIPLTDRDGVQTVNARDLHAFLGVGKVFGAWVVDRIEAYSFQENKDFVVVSENGKNPQGGRPTKDYFLSLDMAKELAMVERTDRGREARAYFIECERRAKTAVLDPVALLSDPAVLRGLLADYSQRVETLQVEAAAAKAEATAATGRVTELQPKADALVRIAESDGSFCITDAAKMLQVQPKRLFKWLMERRWIYQRVGGTEKVGYQDKVQSGLLEHKTTTVNRSDGSEKTVVQVRVTTKGITRLSEQRAGDSNGDSELPGPAPEPA